MKLIRQSALTLLAFVALTGFQGCANFQPQTGEQAVFAAKATYEVALSVAVAYKALPACSATVKLPCSDPAVLRQLQAAQPAVRATLDAAETAVRDPKFGGNVSDTAVVAAKATLAAFTAITSTLQTK